MVADLLRYDADTTCPEFDGLDLQHGTMNVHFWQREKKPFFDVEVNYHSDDGGKTWQLPATVKTVDPY